MLLRSAEIKPASSNDFFMYITWCTYHYFIYITFFYSFGDVVFGVMLFFVEVLGVCGWGNENKKKFRSGGVRAVKEEYFPS